MGEGSPPAAREGGVPSLRVGCLDGEHPLGGGGWEYPKKGLSTRTLFNLYVAPSLEILYRRRDAALRVVSALADPALVHGPLHRPVVHGRGNSLVDASLGMASPGIA